MTLEQHRNATLPGLSGPFYPAKLQDLVGALDERRRRGGGYSGSVYDHIAGQVAAYEGRSRLTSKDGYGWFWLLKFAVARGTVVVAMPWLGGPNDQFERSPAIYCTGKGERFMDQILIALANAVRATPIEDLGPGRGGSR